MSSKFGTWLLRLLGRSLGLEELPGVRSTGELRHCLRRERARADRNGQELSLLTLDLTSARQGSLAVSELLLRVSGRVRATDEVGWIERTAIAVLLPDTNSDGAHKLAADLRPAALGLGPSELHWQVYTYPGNWIDDDDSGDQPDTAPRGGPPLQKAVGGELSASYASAAPAPLAAPQAERAHGRPDHESWAREARSLTPFLLREQSKLGRTLDILGASVGLVLASPILLIAAIAVKVSSPGPIIFRQKRVGYGGRVFEIYKLRSMTVDAEARKKELLAHNESGGPTFKMGNDPRITPVGKWLRKSTIDELPQLWNVLIGDMALVGPRPPLPDEVEKYEAWQRRRLELKGGLTCTWQVSGRSEIQFVDWVRMDLRYAEARSLPTDIALIARTVPAVLTGRGAR